MPEVDAPSPAGSIRSRRAARWVLLGLLAATVVFGLTRVQIDTSVDSFVARNDDAYDQLVRRDTEFGGDPIVVVLRGSGRSGLLLDQRQLVGLIGLEGQLSGLPDVAVVYGPGTVLNQTAASIQNFLAMISGRRDALMNEAEIKAKREGATGAALEHARDAAVVDFDRRYGALIAEALPVGLPTVRNGRFVANVLLDGRGEPRPEWSFLVPDAKSATILVRPRERLDQEGADKLTAAVRAAIADSNLAIDEPVVTGVPVLSSSMADRVRTEGPLLGAVALLGVGLVLWLSPWASRRRDRLRPLAAAVLGTATTLAVFGLLGRPLSLGVVAFLPVVLGIGSDFPLYLHQPTQRRRVLVAAGAAAAAFASLTISPLPFVREFGVALAVGLSATIVWALILRSVFPVAEQVFARDAAGATPGPTAGPRLRKVLATSGVLVAVAGCAALPSLRIESNPNELAKGLPQLAQVQRAEQILGFSGEISLVVRGKDVLSPAALAWQRQAIDEIVSKHADEMRPLLTTERLLSFLGTAADSGQITSGSKLLPPYLLGSVVSADRSSASSSFGITIDDVARQQHLIAEIERELPKPPNGYRAELVGLPVVAAHGLSAMESGRYLLNAAGVLIAGCVLWIGLRSKRIAIMTMAAAVLSSGWILAGLWLFGADLNPLTLAIGALATVTACEFTVMLDSGERGLPWIRRSVTTAACAGTVGYLSLMLSELQLLRTFGATLAAAVVSSYLAARLVTMLAGRAADVPSAVPTASGHRPHLEVVS